MEVARRVITVPLSWVIQIYRVAFKEKVGRAGIMGAHRICRLTGAVWLPARYASIIGLYCPERSSSVVSASNVECCVVGREILSV